MNAMVDKIVRSLLYEGYLLYPYRASTKNQMRWTFGNVYPRAWSQEQQGADACFMQTDCLLKGSGATRIEVSVRFLQLLNRSCGKPELLSDSHDQPWQEAVERQVALPPVTLESLLKHPHTHVFLYPAHVSDEPTTPPIHREQALLQGTVTVSAVRLEAGLRLRVGVENNVSIADTPHLTRDVALMHSLVSTHIVLSACDGDFISLIDPPESCATAARECQNIGCWPVLIGEPNARNTMLASPVILYDYPQVSQESPGDLFDATEIDEILTLRILTLTDEEKRAAARLDPRAAALMERTHALSGNQRLQLHAAMRGPQTPFTDNDDRRKNPAQLQPGARVRLWPKRGGDIWDVCLKGMTATIAAIEQDFEDRVHVAVTIDDDPGAELGRNGDVIGHRFFFSPEEIELLP